MLISWFPLPRHPIHLWQSHHRLWRNLRLQQLWMQNRLLRLCPPKHHFLSPCPSLWESDHRLRRRMRWRQHEWVRRVFLKLHGWEKQVLKLTHFVKCWFKSLFNVLSDLRRLLYQTEWRLWGWKYGVFWRVFIELYGRIGVHSNEYPKNWYKSCRNSDHFFNCLWGWRHGLGDWAMWWQ